MAKGIRLLPQEIERKSFQIIRRRVDLRRFPAELHPIILRVVHATGDVQTARQLRFSRGVAAAAKKAIRSGARIITDVNMVKAGINSELMRVHGNRAVCAIRHADVAKRAKAEGITRAAAAMQKHRKLLNGGIAVIGNAPTALYAVLDMVASGVRPALIVGVPVGFVGAAESKEELEKCEVPFITLRGTRGGSGVAAGIVNALLMMSMEG